MIQRINARGGNISLGAGAWIVCAALKDLGIKEKTGRFYNMDADSDEKITYQEFRAYFQAKVKCQN